MIPGNPDRGCDEKLRSLDLFSCIGCHALGFQRAGIETVALCEINPWRRAKMAEQGWGGVPIHDDVRTMPHRHTDIVIGGPPCQNTSVASAVHGYRSGESLWDAMYMHLGGKSWVVVEQPPGNAAWEAKVTDDLRGTRRHVARFEFGACDFGAPYLRRRVFLVACASLSRLEVARSAVPRAIERVARAADARGDWDPDQLAALRVDARSAGEMDRGPASARRRQAIEALGDSNPPHMAEAIGLAILATSASKATGRVSGNYLSTEHFHD